MKQRTLKDTCYFEGKGLHTGKYAHMTLLPAPVDSGVVFVRTDLGVRIPALADNVTNTARSTTLACGGASVQTVEHLLSALTGMGIDNAVVEIDAPEVPILDGSASRYVEAIAAAGIAEQDKERKYVELEEPVVVMNGKGSFVKIIPSDHLSYDLSIDFNSRVLGVQNAHWDESIDYASQVAVCRTFVFFHEIEFLASQGLVKGGDVDNAIVIVEHPASDEQLKRMASVFNQPLLSVTEKGYLNNLRLHFENECGRHKLLDLIGDLRLSGVYLKAHIIAYKPGHGINTEAAAAVRNNIK